MFFDYNDTLDEYLILREANVNSETVISKRVCKIITTIESLYILIVGIAGYCEISLRNINTKFKLPLFLFQ